MKLKTLQPIAFGKFSEEAPILLEDGFNIIVGDNESGKTTLGSFILGMFYGFKKEGRTRISRMPEYERYRPWSGKEYKGIVTYEEDGRFYRIERRFDPDSVNIYDETTGEDITSCFDQDTRKEYDFAQTHLGLSAKEFRNTVWIGQLESQQESDLGLAIQSRLQNVLQGGSEEFSFARALSVLNAEKGKIKTPRSTRARLDLVQERVEELKAELKRSKDREAQIREVLIQLKELRLEEKVLGQESEKAARNVGRIRASLLKSVILAAGSLKDQMSDLEKQISRVEWAKNTPSHLEGEAESYRRELEIVEDRIERLQSDIDKLLQKKKETEAELKQFEPVLGLGLDSSELSGLHSKYLVCKASAARGERQANEARRELRKLEQEKKGLGSFDSESGEELITKAEELQSIVFLSEREKAKCEVEAERARSGVTQVSSSGATGWIYALSLTALGVAIVFTIMGLPTAIPAFGISVLVFGIGTFRHRKILYAKSIAQQELDLKVRLVEEQMVRVADAEKAMSEFLEFQNVRSVEELRSKIGQALGVLTRYNNAKDQYELAHRYWFESSQEFSVVEKRLGSALVSGECLSFGQAITDKAVSSLKNKLGAVARLEANKQGVLNRVEECDREIGQLEAKKEQILAKEQHLFDASGVSCREEFNDKIAARKKYYDYIGALQNVEGKLEAVLGGRQMDSLEKEYRELENDLGAIETVSGLTEVDYQRALGQLSTVKEKISDMRTKLASMEKEINLRQREGRPTYVIEEELVKEQAEKQMLEDAKDALDQAISSLETLSLNMRREFAPVLNERVGQILEEITDGRYVDVRVSPDLEMSVIHPRSENQAPIEALSAGTVDQCYFAIRVAIAELITNKDSFPLFLDDSFAQYDDNRLKQVLKVIDGLSSRHQIILFSCQGRERRMAKQLGLKYNLIELSV